MDSPSVFGALLDDRKGGRFSVHPVEESDSVSEYVPDTNVLVTRFRTRSGAFQLTDFMRIAPGGEQQERPELLRVLEGLEGAVEVDLVFEPRFDYARAETALEKVPRGILATGAGVCLMLTASFDTTADGARATGRLVVRKGDRHWLHLIYGADRPAEFDAGRVNALRAETECYWRDWLSREETGVTLDFGPYRQMVNRSALVLKLLSFNPTGAIAAAGTTSLPEKVGGVRNWDYRYTWVRDTAFTLQALFRLGHLSETEGYLRWIAKILAEHGAGQMQIMYGLRGETHLPETELTHLDGYKGSRPVRIGNEAAQQRQLDIYGELMEAALMLSNYVGKVDAKLWPFLRGVCDYVVEHWQDKDQGIWEVRCGPYDFVYSKVMCWVALDRGITIAKRYGFVADMATWNETRELIKATVLNKGWNEEKRAFVQHFDTEALDASALLFPLLNFLPVGDPKIRSTIEAVRRELGSDVFLYRYKSEDGLPGDEGFFLLCTFWLVDCLIEMDRLQEAEVILNRMQNAANPLGLFSEEYDPVWKEMLGNFPQAFTHIGYINSVLALLSKKNRKEEVPKRKTKLSLARRLFGRELLLNDGPPRGDANDIAVRLKSSMNILRGAFFRTAEGRVAYEEMRHAKAYKEYVRLSYLLKKMDLNSLESREDKIAFWVNLYNVLVIHGVVELEVRDSVKEVRNFFRRIQYQIGDMRFTPDDIEHGILRGNRRPPHSLFPRFTSGDPRLKHSLAEMDPRIHFALVCASSSCPPIDVYTPENLDEDLTVSGRTFLNSGGLLIDREANRVSLSLVFKWYRDDFGESDEQILRGLAKFLYNDEDRTFLEWHADQLKIIYQDYDWRLNRS
jgi:GH15 family glucan-1,4-alpha-glucosidase